VERIGRSMDASPRHPGSFADLVKWSLVLADLEDDSPWPASCAGRGAPWRPQPCSGSRQLSASRRSSSGDGMTIRAISEATDVRCLQRTVVRQPGDWIHGRYACTPPRRPRACGLDLPCRKRSKSIPCPHLSPVQTGVVRVRSVYARLRQTTMMLVLAAPSGSRSQSPYCRMTVKPLW